MSKHAGVLFFFGLAVLGFGFAYFRTLLLVRRMKMDRESTGFRTRRRPPIEKEDPKDP